MLQNVLAEVLPERCRMGSFDSLTDRPWVGRVAIPCQVAKVVPDIPAISRHHVAPAEGGFEGHQTSSLKPTRQDVHLGASVHVAELVVRHAVEDRDAPGGL